MTLSLALAVAMATAAQAPAAPTFEIRELHPRVHAAMVVQRPPYYAFANSLVVVGDSGVLIVDTQQSPGAAGDLIRTLPGITDQPVRWIVNTHWHGDHVYGNAAWKAAFPDARIIGHASLLEDVPGRATEALRKEIADLPPSIDERRRWLRDGHRDGVPFDSATRAALEYSLEMRERQLGQIHGLRLLPPDLTVADSMDIDLGGILVRLLHVGPAHTRGDLVVHVPAARILAVGDLLERSTPWLDGACPRGWARALRRIRDLPADSLLMSHGTVVAPPFLALYADLLDAIAAGRDLTPFRSRAPELGVRPETFDRFATSVPDLVAAADSSGACAP